MAPQSRKVVPTFARVGWLLLLASCDPNIVIGSRLGPNPPEGGSGGAGMSLSGSSGMGASAGLPTGGMGVEPVAGAPDDAGAAGETSSPRFEATHEDGSLARWDSGPDPDAGGWYGDDSTPQYSGDGPAHSGTGAVKVTVDTSPGDRISRLYRRVTATDAFYSAWFYLAEAHTPTDWWSIFLFKAGKERAQSIDLWSVNLTLRDDGQLTLAVFDHASNTMIPSPAPPLVEVGKWFQLEAFLQASSGQPSQVIYYLDGIEFLTLDDATPAPDGELLYWVIGNGGNNLVPPITTVYIDDAEGPKGQWARRRPRRRRCRQS